MSFVRWHSSPLVRSCRSLATVGIAMCLAIQVVGCATVTFKRGASPGDMSADEVDCRARGGDDARFVACMRERGWMVVGGAAQAANGDAETKPGQPAERAAASPQLSPAASSAPSEAAPSAAAERTATTPAASAQTGAASPSTIAAAAGTRAYAPDATPAPMDATEPTDEDAGARLAATAPDARISVASWWKFGGSAADLSAAVNDCVDSLGPANRPDEAATVVTVALRDCLTEAGWHALGVKTLQ